MVDPNFVVRVGADITWSGSVVVVVEQNADHENVHVQFKRKMAFREVASKCHVFSFTGSRGLRVYCGHREAATDPQICTNIFT